MMPNKRVTRVRRPAAKTPIRSALLPTSALQSTVKDGLRALKTRHRSCIDQPLQGDFADSLDLDQAMRVGHERENRWDYLVGHAPSRKVVALEPHCAKEDAISTVIAKRAAAMEQLQAHLSPGVRVGAWLWVASGKVYFADTEKARRRLDQNGIQFVGTRVLAKHLPREESAP
jgi:hypothetical protein